MYSVKTHLAELYDLEKYNPDLDEPISLDNIVECIKGGKERDEVKYYLNV